VRGAADRMGGLEWKAKPRPHSGPPLAAWAGRGLGPKQFGQKGKIPEAHAQIVLPVVRLCCEDAPCPPLHAVVARSQPSPALFLWPPNRLDPRPLSRILRPLPLPHGHKRPDSSTPCSVPALTAFLLLRAVGGFRWQRKIRASFAVHRHLATRQAAVKCPPWV
jgi:hypothetical protein